MKDSVGEISRLIAYAKELSFPLNIEEDFLTRFKLQKLAFLLRVLNNEEIEDFNVYTHGPYSPDETTLYYGYSRNEIQIKEVKTDNEQVVKLKEVFSVNDNVVEGATTMIYLIKTGNASWKNTYQKLNEVKPRLSIDDRVDSINTAKEFLMTKEDYERIKDIVKKEVMELGSTYEEDIFDKL
jgi:uncharacterized protein YwgA